MRRGGGIGVWRRWALRAAGVLVLVLAVAQLILPVIASSVISSRVGRYGKVQSVSVSAWPAVKLLWGSADSVTVRARSLHLEPAQAAKLLWEARSTTRVDASVESVRIGSLALTAARLSKRGSALSAQAQASPSDVAGALPSGVSLRLLRSEGGEVQVRASGGLFGVGGAFDAVAQASGGRLLARPLSSSLAGLRLTLFSDRHVYVEGVDASVLNSVPLAYGLSMRASLR